MKENEFPYPNKLILLVDDHIQTQELMKDMVEDVLGCSLDIASNGIEALEAWNRKKYDLILMDLQMPIMDGYQTSIAIRNLEKTAHTYTPILALTASTLAEDRTSCLKAGMDDYLSKPITVSIFESKLKEIFSKSHPQSRP